MTRPTQMVAARRQWRICRSGGEPNLLRDIATVADLGGPDSRSDDGTPVADREIVRERPKHRLTDLTNT